ncbi:MAG: hypothetical protein ACKOK8_05320 [Planctomycetia bacterium]
MKLPYPRLAIGTKSRRVSPTKKICRPRQIYTGETLRDFVPMAKRG